ncbi:unnamed protein product [Adineta steineri]|uniref:Homeobox domain-containing protein n=1 Tax=Adineta steineri TaxID=433720 RepID=A0A815BNH2_9BILA|nr:unnamed protein product [Adineta steineri]
MVDYYWSWDFLAECAAKLIKLEQNFTNEQLQYLREYYTMNHFPEQIQMQEIANQWHIDDFDFYMNVSDWFFCRRMAHQEFIQRRDVVAKTAA